MLHEELAMKFNNSLIMRNAPYHMEFVLANVIECLPLYFLGFYLFNNRNLNSSFIIKKIKYHYLFIHSPIKNSALKNTDVIERHLSF